MADAAETRLAVLEVQSEDAQRRLKAIEEHLQRLSDLVSRLEQARDEDAQARQLAKIRAEERARARAELGLPSIDPDSETTITGVTAVRRPSPWAATAREALDLVGTRGGIAVLLAVTSLLLGPEVVESLTELAAAWTQTDVSVDMQLPPVEETRLPAAGQLPGPPAPAP